MPDHHYELEIKVKNAANDEATRHLELTTVAPTPREASDELVKALIQAKGASRVKEVVNADS